MDKASKKVDAIAALVPKPIADMGTLTIAAATYPPAVIEPTDGSTPTGRDIENVRQIAAVLGLNVDIKTAPFNGIIAGLQAGRYDGATGEIYAPDERTATVTFEIGFARGVADEVVFMSEGRLVEKGPPSQVIDAPVHESTRTFIDGIL